MQRVTALLRSSCSASIAGNIRWSVFGGVTAGGFSASVIWAAALLSLRRGAGGMLSWWCGGGRVREKGGLYLEDWLHVAPVLHPSSCSSRFEGRCYASWFCLQILKWSRNDAKTQPQTLHAKELWFMPPHVLLRGNRFKFASVNKTKTETQARRDTTVALHLLPELIRNKKNKWLDSLYLTHELYIKVKLEQTGLKKALLVPQFVWGSLK